MNPADYLKTGERIDDLERNGLKIIQDPGRFCFGMDAVLLSGYAAPVVKKGARVLDLGTGNGIIPILLSAKTKARTLTGLEIQEESADMARRSVLLNGIGDRVNVVNGDIREADRIFPGASFDVLTSNPPYLPASDGLHNPDVPKAVARHELLCSFADLVRVSAKLLPPGGHFVLVHRPFRLPEILSGLSAAGVEPKRMRLVYPDIDHEPTMVLLDCIRGAKPRLSVDKPLIIYKAPGKYTDEIYTIYGY